MRVTVWDINDYLIDYHDKGLEINEEDLAKLTDLEYEALGEDLNDWLDMKEGETQTVEQDY